MFMVVLGIIATMAGMLLLGFRQLNSGVGRGAALHHSVKRRNEFPNAPIPPTNIPPQNGENPLRPMHGGAPADILPAAHDRELTIAKLRKLYVDACDALLNAIFGKCSQQWHRTIGFCVDGWRVDTHPFYFSAAAYAYSKYNGSNNGVNFCLSAFHTTPAAFPHLLRCSHLSEF
jgi:hypothetical protein